MNYAKRISWISLAAVVIALPACGNDDDDTPAPVAAPSPSGAPSAWTQLTLITDCDRGAAPTPLPGPGPGTSTATGTATGVTTVTGTSTSTGTDARMNSADPNLLNDWMQAGNLRCAGTGSAFMLTRDGRFTMPNGNADTLTPEQLQEVVTAADALLRAEADRTVNCETSAQVRDDEMLRAEDANAEIQILFTSDVQDRRRCFRGNQAEVQRLRDAWAPVTDRYRTQIGRGRVEAPPVIQP